MVIGVVCGIMGAVLLSAVLFIQKKRLTSSTTFLSGIGAVLAVVCIAVVAAWARDAVGDDNPSSFLGEPSWETNLIAWHAVSRV